MMLSSSGAMCAQLLSLYVLAAVTITEHHVQEASGEALDVVTGCVLFVCFFINTATLFRSIVYAESSKVLLLYGLGAAVHSAVVATAARTLPNATFAFSTAVMPASNEAMALLLVASVANMVKESEGSTGPVQQDLSEHVSITKTLLKNVDTTALLDAVV